jgi:hypothetical protein
MRGLSFLLIVAALGGCGGSGSGTPSDPSPESIVARTTTETGAQKSFHFKLEVKNPAPSSSGLSLTFADGDVIVPDRLKAKIAGTFNGIPITTQIVFAGPKQYLLNPLSKSWQSFSTSTSPIAFFSPAKGVLTAVKAATDLKLDGTRTVGGVESYHLVGRIKARDVAGFLGNTPSDLEADAEIDVGKDDGLLRKLTLSGRIAAEEPDDAERTVTLSRFGEQVTIEAPAEG